jgi:hypothetical protein
VNTHSKTLHASIIMNTEQVNCLQQRRPHGMSVMGLTVAVANLLVFIVVVYYIQSAWGPYYSSNSLKRPRCGARRSIKYMHYFT